MHKPLLVSVMSLTMALAAMFSTPARSMEVPKGKCLSDGQFQLAAAAASRRAAYECTSRLGCTYNCGWTPPNGSPCEAPGGTPEEPCQVT
jgi:hypothetical protein